MESYLEIEITENRARGMTPPDAASAARRKLGNRMWIQEQIYRMNTVRWFRQHKGPKEPGRRHLRAMGGEKAPPGANWVFHVRATRTITRHRATSVRHYYHKWVKGLPGPNTTIISLLGHKPDGNSEFSFYTFQGREDTPSEARGKQSLQAFLDQHHYERRIMVIEHPTTDFRPIADDTLDRIAHDVQQHLAEGRTIVLIDSGGQTHTGTVCKHLGLVEDTRT